MGFVFFGRRLPRAYLAGERHIVTPSLSFKVETLLDAERVIGKQLHDLIICAYASFAEAGRAQAMAMKNTAQSSPRVGRNEPCPCGSGKKYSRAIWRCRSLLGFKSGLTAPFLALSRRTSRSSPRAHSRKSSANILRGPSSFARRCLLEKLQRLGTSSARR